MKVFFKFVRSSLTLVQLICLILVAPSFAADVPQEEVKKSKSGVCHCPGGQFYDRTSNYIGFKSIEACLDSGGRQPKSGQGDCSSVSADEVRDNVLTPKQSKPQKRDPSEEGTVQKVKKSKSGVCHCPGGQFYNRTSNYEEFDSVQACIDSGGRQPKSGQDDCSLVIADSSSTSQQSASYDRSLFGNWSDNDEDCQNTRHERLISLSLGPLTLTEDGCLVKHGYWIDPYTGKSHVDSRNLDVDHLVPLHYAWQRGASLWQPEKRQRFMNDPANLLVVETTVNRAKKAFGPLEWLPPESGFHCEYLLRFNRVISRYGLTHSPVEATAIELLTEEKCDQT